jgi:CRP-like cAMP-binding protein
MSILASIELFQSLSQTEENTLALFCQERLLMSGEVLFSEGSDAIALYIVKTGSLEAYRERSDGKIVLGNIGTNELVGEMAIFDESVSKKRTASVRATADSVVLIIMDYAIKELSKKHTDIYEKIVNIINERKKLAV